MEWKQSAKGQKSKLDGQHFICDDTCISFAELQSATMTKRKTTHHATGLTRLYVKRPWRAFQPGMPVEQDFAGKQKADVRGLSSAAIPDVHYLWMHIDLRLFLDANRKRKWNSALDSLSAKLFYKGLQWSHHRTKLRHFRSRWCNIVLATPQPCQIRTTPIK